MDTGHFSLYSVYYNLLYRNKDYKSEVEYVLDIFHSEFLKIEKILEFGSGTGRHGLILRNKGYDIYGLEKSPAMVKQAQEAGFSCEQADITDFKLDRTFDVVLALFHVISYLNENKEIIQAFENAARHLKPGGLFIFDIWYLPAVLNQLPENRIKKVSDQEYEIIRFATPEMHFNRNVVDVNYHFLVKNKRNDQCEEFEEKHSMRYFSIPEIDLFAETTGFEVLRAEEFLTGQTPSPETWGVCFILKKK